MKFHASHMRQRGFSLVELMVVVGIIGILAALAVPRFRSFQAKARQTEAKTNLSHIYTLQESFFADTDTYFGSPNAISTGTVTGPAACNVNNALGFYVTDCTRVRYTYTVTAAAGNVWTGTAQEFGGRVFPNCTGGENQESWTINESKVLTGVPDARVGALLVCN